MRDKFEYQIGQKLRNATAPVPPNSWNAIQQKLQSAAAPAAGFTTTWIGAVAGVVLLLGGLTWYSHLKSDNKRSLPSETELIGKAKVSPIQNENDGSVATSNFSQADVDSASARLTKMEPFEKSAPVKNTPVEVRANWSAEDLFPAPAAIKPTLPVSIDMEEKPGRLRNSEEVHKIVEELKSRSLQNEPTSTEPARITAANTNGYAPFELAVTAENNAREYRWEVSNGKTSQGKSLNVTLNKPGIYTVYLSTTDREGNVSTDMVEIEVLEGSKLFVPNSFTPNGDGINDVYKVEGVLIEDFVMQIKTVEGDVVFETHDLNEGWNPDLYLLKDKTSQPQLFIVTVVAKDANGKRHTINKKINLIY